jgi:serine protease Do
MSARNLGLLAVGGAALLVALGVLTAAGVFSAGSTPRAAAATDSSSTATSPRELAAHYANGVVEIAGPPLTAAGTNGGSAAAVLGSGFVVSGSGLVLTSARFVDRHGVIAKTVTVVLRPGSAGAARLTGEIVCVDAGHDLAVVRIDPSRAAALVTLPMGDSNSLRSGEQLVALGRPTAAGPAPVAATVSATGRAVRGLGGTPLTVATLAPPSGVGIMAGAPLLDPQGRVVAVLDRVAGAGGRGAATAVPIDDAAKVIADARAD